MKRILSILFLSLSVLLVGGCGSSEQSKILDDYSFGRQSFGAGSSRITLEMPFAIGQTNGLPWMEQIGKSTALQNVTFQGADQRVSVIVMGEVPQTDAATVSVETLAENSILKLKQSSAVRNLKTDIKPVTISEHEAYRVEATYEQGALQLGMVQYFFMDKGILWNVIYLYRANDPEAVALVQYIDKDITIHQ